MWKQGDPSLLSSADEKKKCGVSNYSLMVCVLSPAREQCENVFEMSIEYRPRFKRILLHRVHFGDCLDCNRISIEKKGMLEKWTERENGEGRQWPMAQRHRAAASSGVARSPRARRFTHCSRRARHSSTAAAAVRWWRCPSAMSRRPFSISALYCLSLSV